ncbi:hypothetical protein CCACVL1_22376 [Corchorus capsularis]|uniref:Uncharacterized protein n=1 Tax=Corchorus capsularis TaxID=210143 RepID=A0A1R3H049_COCAP|nr:hypothetical protein CCACVL1_22376 [Corchorus capsularis]
MVRMLASPYRRRIEFLDGRPALLGT